MKKKPLLIEGAFSLYNDVETILEAIGHTPLVPLKRSLPEGSANVYAKLERFNPGGSLKDRIVLRILEEAERKRLLKKGGTIVAGTTGNSGIGLAYIGNVKKGTRSS